MPSKKSPKKGVNKESVGYARFSKIRAFVNFEYRGPQDDAKVRRYEKELAPLIKQPHAVLKTRSKKNFKEAADSAGLNPRLKGIKAIPVPSRGIADAHAFFKGKKLIIQSKYERSEFIKLSRTKLAKNARAHITEKLSDRPKGEKYKIATGKHFMRPSFYPDDLMDEIERLMDEYAEGTTGSEKHGGSTWEDWLGGIQTVEKKNQKSNAQARARWAKEEEKFAKNNRELNSKIRRAKNRHKKSKRKAKKK